MWSMSKNHIRHNISATKRITNAFPHLLANLPEVLQSIYDPAWFPKKYACIKDVISELIQRLFIDQQKKSLGNRKASNRLFSVENEFEKKT